MCSLMVPLFGNSAFYVTLEHSRAVRLQSVTCIKEKESRLVGTIGKCCLFPPTVLFCSSVMSHCCASLQCGNIFEGNPFPRCAKIFNGCDAGEIFLPSNMEAAPTLLQQSLPWAPNRNCVQHVWLLEECVVGNVRDMPTGICVSR